MNVLVTGASGFVGQSLLLKANQYPQIQKTVAIFRRPEQIFHNHKENIFPIVVPSLDQLFRSQALLSEADCIIHLAARAHILNDPSADPETEFLKVNTQGTYSLAQAALSAGVKQFIFISSIGAMTTLSTECLHESREPTPDTPYGRSKLAAEKALIDLLHSSSMKYTILRPTLVYGPQNPGNMERLLKLVNKNLPLPLGSIKNQRSLIFVGNLIDAIVQCIDNPNAYNQTFLLSDGHDISTPDLIKQIALSLNKKPNLLPIPTKLLKLAGQLTGKSDTIDRLTGSLIVDSSKIRQTLNWTPPYTFQEGIQATCDWYLQSR